MGCLTGLWTVNDEVSPYNTLTKYSKQLKRIDEGHQVKDIALSSENYTGSAKPLVALK